MKCDELLQGMNDYVDGEWQSAICRALQEHLAECNPCQIVIDNIRHTITLYRAGEVVPLPAKLHEQLSQIVRRHWAARFPQDAV